MNARAPLIPETVIPAIPRGIPVLQDALLVVTDRLMHSNALDADVARLQLSGAVRQLRNLGDAAGDRVIKAHLGLVSLALDKLSANVKTACEIALGAGADLDRSRAHSILASMRENLQHDADDLSAQQVKPGEFFPELEVSADRLVRIMREQVTSVAADNDASVLAVRERAH